MWHRCSDSYRSGTTHHKQVHTDLSQGVTMSARTSSESHRLVATTRQRTVPIASPRDRRVFVGAIVLAVLSVGGAIISVAGGLSSTIWEAMGPTGRLSIPIPMMLAQLAAAWLAAGSRRRPALLASALLALVEPICVISGFYDGGYSDPDRSSLHVAYQILFVAAIAVVGVLAALRFSALVRRRD
jgi:hypothetical protein